MAINSTRRTSISVVLCGSGAGSGERGLEPKSVCQCQDKSSGGAAGDNGSGVERGDDHGGGNGVGIGGIGGDLRGNVGGNASGGMGKEAGGGGTGSSGSAAASASEPHDAGTKLEPF